MHYYGILAGGSFWHKNSCIKDCLDDACLVPTLVAGYSRALGLRSACGSLTVSPEPLGQFPARNGEQRSPDAVFGCNLSAPGSARPLDQCRLGPLCKIIHLT